MQRRNDQERITNANSEMIAEIEVMRANSKMKNAKLAKIVNFAKVEVENAFFECLHTISDTQIERDESFDNEKDEKLIKFANVKVVMLIE